MLPRPCKTLILLLNECRFGKVGRLASEDVVLHLQYLRYNVSA